MNLIDVTRELATDEQCFSFLEAMRWPNGVRCPVCGAEKISRITRKTPSKNKRANLYQCLEPICKQQFSVTSGTIFHDSRVPLSKWFMAISLIMDAKKGMSAKQLQQHLGLGSYQTAWHMAHRIREAMSENDPAGLSGVVEMDETYVGGKHQGHQHKPGHPLCKKQVVVGLRQRGGIVKMVHVPDAKVGTLREIAERHVNSDVEMILTDDYAAYPIALRSYPGKHQTINHSTGLYVRGVNNEIHTNTIENAFSLFKRGIIGNFHKVSIKHLHRYLSEFEFRFNQRKNDKRFELMVSRTAQASPLTYRTLVDGPEPIPF